MQAYKRAALRFHPDKVAAEERKDAEKKFKQVGAAHAILSDPAKRQKYDAGECAAAPSAPSLRCHPFTTETLLNVLPLLLPGRSVLLKVLLAWRRRTT